MSEETSERAILKKITNAINDGDDIRALSMTAAMSLIAFQSMHESLKRIADALEYANEMKVNHEDENGEL